MKEYLPTSGNYAPGYERKFHQPRRISKNQSFEERGFVFVPKLVDDVKVIQIPVPPERGLFKFRKYDVVHLPETQVEGSVARYNIPYYRQLHLWVQKRVESILEIDLFPTYYYDRFYFAGQELRRHSDRESCEISVSLQISSNHPDNPWPIWFEEPNRRHSYVLMNDGDAVIYRGFEREHWRDPLPSRYNKTQKLWRRVRKLPDDTYHHQIFLHYVDANGPFCQFAFDKGF